MILTYRCDELLVDYSHLSIQNADPRLDLLAVHFLKICKSFGYRLHSLNQKSSYGYITEKASIRRKTVAIIKERVITRHKISLDRTDPVLRRIYCHASKFIQCGCHVLHPPVKPLKRCGGREPISAYDLQQISQRDAIVADIDGKPSPVYQLRATCLKYRTDDGRVLTPCFSDLPQQQEDRRGGGAHPKEPSDELLVTLDPEIGACKRMMLLEGCLYHAPIAGAGEIKCASQPDKSHDDAGANGEGGLKAHTPSFSLAQGKEQRAPA